MHFCAIIKPKVEIGGSATRFGYGGSIMVKTKGAETNLSSDKLLRIIEYMAANHLPMRLKDISDNLQIAQLFGSSDR